MQSGHIANVIRIRQGKFCLLGVYKTVEMYSLEDKKELCHLIN